MSFWQKLFGQKSLSPARSTPPGGSSAPSVSADPQRAKSNGEAVICGSCKRLLKVNYYEAGKQVFATPETLKSQALRCQDCGFIVCGSCVMPPGGGGAVCPSCKKVGGPYFFTREAELGRKMTMDSLDSQPVFTAGQADFIVELVGLVKKDNSGFANLPRIRVIGEELNRQGGIKLTQQVFSKVRATGSHFSQDIWDGIGEWQQ